ncbi:FAD-binding protein, partial [Escherichia coli]|uniref:FAD-binding protein n=1 Tax=Escherichia coli TaxID=562 RepID=UPI0020201460
RRAKAASSVDLSKAKRVVGVGRGLAAQDDLKMVHELAAVLNAAHMVPEGGLAMVPQLVNDGVMIVGDAAGFCLNLGFTVRGMD